MGNIICR